MATDNTSAFAALEDKIARYRIKLAGVPRESIPYLVGAIEAEQKRTINARTDAYGTPWKPKKNGETEFRFVNTSQVIVGAIGLTLITRITERIAVLHHLGRTPGGIARNVIPINRIPPRVVIRMKTIIAEAFQRAAGVKAAA